MVGSDDVVADAGGPAAWTVTVTVGGTTVAVTVVAAGPDVGAQPTNASDTSATDARFLILNPPVHGSGALECGSSSSRFLTLMGR